MKLLVLGGGTSPERDVSLRSAQAVGEALAALGHEVKTADPRDGREAVTEAAQGCQLALPILHGAGGEDGTVQQVLEAAGIPYLGAGIGSSELCFDKVRLKGLLAAHQILTPRGAVIRNAAELAANELAQAPFILKPIDGGSSVDMLLVRQLPYDTARAEELLGKYGSMLLEELVLGTEITVPVLGSEALPVVEIIPPAGAEFDYENKYNGKTAEICPARSLSAALQEQAQRLAEQVHELAGVRHLSRTDMIVTAGGQIYVLEINTIPGMTAQSLMPKSAAAAGLSWVQFVARLVELAAPGGR